MQRKEAEGVEVMGLMDRSQVMAARKQRGWSRLTLAVRAGVALTTLQRLEAGTSEVQCRSTTLIKLHRALYGDNDTRAVVMQPRGGPR